MAGGMVFCPQAWAAEGGADKAKKQTEHAQKTTATKLSEISVTASRIDKNRMETAAFIDVVTQEDMERLGGFDVYEILKRNGGLNFNAHMPFGLRMGNLDSSIGFRGIKNCELVLLDGLPIMDPGYGHYNIDMIPATFLERVETVAGSSSVLYGSQAMTGVINMQLRNPGSPMVTGQVLGGTDGSVQASAVYRNDLVVLGAAYSRADEYDGMRKYYSATSPYEANVLPWYKAAAMIGVQPWKPLTINYMFNYLDSGWGRDYSRSPSSNYEVDEQSYQHYFLATYQQGNFKASPYFFYTNAKSDYNYAAAGKPNQLREKKNFTTGFDVQNFNQFSNLRLLYGATFIYEHQDEDNESVSGSSSSGYTKSHEILKHHRSQGSVFVQGEYDINKIVFLTAGARFTGLWPDSSDLDTMYEVVPQVQGLYRLNRENSIYANVGRAFRAPSFSELYQDRDGWAPNPDLEPEHGWTYEVGWKTNYKFISASIGAFYMDFDDKITTIWFDSLDAYKAVNADTATSIGVEWRIRARLMDSLSFDFSGYAADPEEESSGETTQAGPKYQLTPGLFYNDGKFDAGIYVECLLERERGLPDYTNVHLNAGYMVTDWLKVKLQVDNLLDDKNQVIYGNMSPTARTTYASYEPGIWVLAGVEIYLDLL